MNPGDTTVIDVASNMVAGRFWPRTDCIHDSEGHLQCKTGQCYIDPNDYVDDGTECNPKNGGQPPYTIAEMTLNAFGGPDFYDLSLVDGFTVPMTISQVNRTNTSNVDPRFDCGTAECDYFDFNECPPELQLFDDQNIIIACMSICTAVNNANQRQKWPILMKIWNSVDPNTGYPLSDLVCCACGPNNGGCHDPRSHYCCSPYNHDPAEKGGKCYVESWPLASTGQRYDQVFKFQCPDAYSWQFDDQQSTYQCIDADYDIDFC